MSRRLVLITGTSIVAVTAAVVGLGVSGSAAAYDDVPEASATTVYVPSVHAAALPLDAYQLSDVQEAEKGNVQILMTRACMKSFGLSYLPHYTDRTKIISATFAVYNSRRYGVSDPVAASQFGYHLPPQPIALSSSENGDQADTSPLTMPPDKRRVFAGAPAERLPSSTAKTADAAVSPGTYNGKAIPAGGCFGQTHRALLDFPAADLVKANDLAARLNQEAFTKANEDRRALTLNTAWAQCMAAKGYHGHTTPMQAAAKFDLNNPATKTEIETAVADVACQQQVKYVSILTAVETEYQNISIAKHTDTLAPLKARVAEKAAALTRALRDYAE